MMKFIWLIKNRIRVIDKLVDSRIHRERPYEPNNNARPFFFWLWPFDLGLGWGWFPQQRTAMATWIENYGKSVFMFNNTMSCLHLRSMKVSSWLMRTNDSQRCLKDTSVVRRSRWIDHCKEKQEIHILVKNCFDHGGNIRFAARHHADFSFTWSQVMMSIHFLLQPTLGSSQRTES